MNLCSYAIDWLTYWLIWPKMEWSWKIHNLILCSKIFEHCHFVQNFPPFDEILSKIQSDPFPLVTGLFKNGLAEKLFPGFLRVLFVYRKTYLLE